MDEAARPLGAAAVAEGHGDGPAPRDPEEIRREIEHTRAELADTAAALAQKADVKGRAKDKVADLRSTLTEKTEDVRSAVSDAAPADASARADEVKQAVQDRPLPFAVAAGLAAGILLGYLMASRRS